MKGRLALQLKIAVLAVMITIMMVFVMKRIVHLIIQLSQVQLVQHVMMAIPVRKMIASKRMAVLVQVRQLKYQPMHVMVDRQA